MEGIGLTLKESEQSYFQDLFNHCDKENQGKLQGPKVAELFRSSQLPAEKLDQIAELCGAKRLGHFGRSQFYIALKLIAAAQNGLVLKPETFSSGIDIPLPRFGSGVMSYEVTPTAPVVAADGVNGLHVSVASVAKPNLNSVASNNSQEINLQPHITQIQYQALVGQIGETDSQNSSPCERGSPKDRKWMSFHQEDPNGESAHSDHDHLLGNEEGESSERHSSDDETEIWTINNEQEVYYTEQFSKMQPDLTKKITGSVAKDFFEKSKLPVHELSKIWQLSDIDKDGALSLAEFCTAMHLVVLRRNNIGLPETLPPSLIPVIPKVAPPTAPLVPTGDLLFQPTPKTSKPTSPTEQLSPQNKEWTKFQESPTSTVSSPGSKPVNFDFSAASVEQDPQILHPVPLRLTPDFQPHHDDDKKDNCAFDSAPFSQTHSTNTTATTVSHPPLTTQSSGNFNNSSNVGIASVLQGPKKEPPPPPPPRPKRNHTRSSSLDLNRIGKSEQFSSTHSGIPPAVPPRISPSAAGAFEVYRKPCASSNVKATSSLSLDFDVNMGGGASILTNDQHPARSIALVRDEAAILSGDATTELEHEKKRYSSAPSVTSATSTLHEKRELQVVIRMQKERNSQLNRMNSELDQELSEIMAERIALEIQLEHMKNSTS